MGKNLSNHPGRKVGSTGQFKHPLTAIKRSTVILNSIAPMFLLLPSLMADRHQD
jgi:hypothetical protein